MKRLYLATILAVSFFLGAPALAAQVLKVGDTGPFELLSAKSNPEGLVLVYIPALSSLLARAADLKHRPLSEAEVQRITNGAEVVAMPMAVADAVIEKRSGIK